MTPSLACGSASTCRPLTIGRGSAGPAVMGSCRDTLALLLHDELGQLRDRGVVPERRRLEFHAQPVLQLAGENERFTRLDREFVEILRQVHLGTWDSEP